MGMLGSSSSSSGGAGVVEARAVGAARGARETGGGSAFSSCVGVGVGAAFLICASSSSSVCAGSRTVGVSSTVECVPVVQGGMFMNSSKVSTRGLQHFHPARQGDQDLGIGDGRERESQTYLSGLRETRVVYMRQSAQLMREGTKEKQSTGGTLI